MKFIKTNRYQIETENIKPRLFFRYTFHIAALTFTMTNGDKHKKIELVKTFDLLPLAKKGFALIEKTISHDF